MRKILTALVLVIAMCGATYAKDVKRCSNDSVVVSERTTIQLVKDITEQGYVVNYYDIDRIVISNPNQAIVQVYDNNWKLIYTTTEKKIDFRVKGGNYHVVSNAPIKRQYRA